jgi:hypothetical protein
MALKAARAWQVRPSEFQSWSLRDKLQAVALLEHEASIGRCGHPHDVSTGDKEGWYEVDDTLVCWACAKLDEYQKEQKDPTPGVQLRIVDTEGLPPALPPATEE